VIATNNRRIKSNALVVLARIARWISSMLMFVLWPIAR
jgi:hypothetical protein